MAETQTDDQIIHWTTSVKKGIEEMSSCLSFQLCVCVCVCQRRGGRGLTWSTDNEDEEREQPGADTFVLARIPLQTQSNDQLDTNNKQRLCTVHRLCWVCLCTVHRLCTVPVSALSPSLLSLSLHCPPSLLSLSLNCPLSLLSLSLHCPRLYWVCLCTVPISAESVSELSTVSAESVSTRAAIGCCLSVLDGHGNISVVFRWETGAGFSSSVCPTVGQTDVLLFSVLCQLQLNLCQFGLNLEISLCSKDLLVCNWSITCKNINPLINNKNNHHVQPCSYPYVNCVPVQRLSFTIWHH